MGAINKKRLAYSVSACLFLIPILTYASALVNGSFANISDNTPTRIILDPTYSGVMATYEKVSDFYDRTGHLPPADTFLQDFPASNPLDFITNRPDGSIWAHFNNNAGDLAGKNIRCVPPLSNRVPNFNAPPLCVSDVNYNNNGVSFLKYTLREYTPSPTLGDSNFLKSYTASTNNTLKKTYLELSKEIQKANTVSSGGSSSNPSNTGPTRISNIISI